MSDRWIKVSQIFYNKTKCPPNATASSCLSLPCIFTPIKGLFICPCLLLVLQQTCFSLFSTSVFYRCEWLLLSSFSCYFQITFERCLKGRKNTGTDKCHQVLTLACFFQKAKAYNPEYAFLFRSDFHLFVQNWHRAEVMKQDLWGDKSFIFLMAPHWSAFLESFPAAPLFPGLLTDPITDWNMKYSLTFSSDKGPF